VIAQPSEGRALDRNQVELIDRQRFLQFGERQPSCIKVPIGGRGWAFEQIGGRQGMLLAGRQWTPEARDTNWRYRTGRSPRLPEPWVAERNRESAV
jgi:hypothetical protein